MAMMKKKEARRAALSEYDGWAKKHPNKASMMGGFLFFRYDKGLVHSVLAAALAGDFADIPAVICRALSISISRRWSSKIASVRWN